MYCSMLIVGHMKRLGKRKVKDVVMIGSVRVERQLVGFNMILMVMLYLIVRYTDTHTMIDVHVHVYVYNLLFHHY